MLDQIPKSHLLRHLKKKYQKKFNQLFNNYKLFKNQLEHTIQN